MLKSKIKIKQAFFLGGAFVLLSFYTIPFFLKTSYKNEDNLASLPNIKKEKKEKQVFHINTPTEVRAIYMTSFVAGEKKMREKLIDSISSTTINAVVIDVKDYTGKIAFDIRDKNLEDFGSEEIRVFDMRDFLFSLGEKNIYRIARVAVFQDPFFVKKRPDLAVKDLKGQVWKDRKGLSWIDPASREYWDYMVILAKESYNAGFDEINFDYIRYPSDGNMSDISYPFSGQRKRADVLKDFFSYLNDNLRKQNIKISADIFGMTTNARDDMGIGQILENTLPYFDAVAPMIYPSHYPPNFQGFSNPAKYPYEIIYYAMAEANKRADIASSSSKVFRPWIQDFDLGANYDEKEIRDQIKALNDLGIKSFMVWSPSNVYTISALK